MRKWEEGGTWYRLQDYSPPAPNPQLIAAVCAGWVCRAELLPHRLCGILGALPLVGDGGCQKQASLVL